MGAVIDRCERDLPHGDWRRLKSLDWEAGADDIGRWALEAVERQPPPGPINGLWFGLVTLGNPGGTMTRTDVYLAGTPQYDPDDGRWVFSINYFPDDKKYARSSVLRDIIAIAWGSLDASAWPAVKDEKLGMDAEWALTLAFTASAIRTRLNPSILSLLQAEDRIGVMVGFDSGDMVKLGELTPTGWVGPAGPS